MITFVVARDNPVEGAGPIVINTVILPPAEDWNASQWQMMIEETKLNPLLRSTVVADGINRLGPLALGGADIGYWDVVSWMGGKWAGTAPVSTTVQPSADSQVTKVEAVPSELPTVSGALPPDPTMSAVTAPLSVSAPTYSSAKLSKLDASMIPETRELPTLGTTDTAPTATPTFNLYSVPWWVWVALGLVIVAVIPLNRER